jgi:hypothetical protein
VARSERNGSPRPYSRIPTPEPLLFLPSSSSIVLARLSGPPLQTHYFSENVVEPEIEPGPLDLQPGTLTTRPQRRSTCFYITNINSVPTSQEIQYISVLHPGTMATRLQRRSTFFYITYINSVRTSHETQYISVLHPGTLATRPHKRS